MPRETAGSCGRSQGVRVQRLRLAFSVLGQGLVRKSCQHFRRSRESSLPPPLRSQLLQDDSGDRILFSFRQSSDLRKGFLNELRHPPDLDRHVAVNAPRLRGSVRVGVAPTSTTKQGIAGVCYPSGRSIAESGRAVNDACGEGNKAAGRTCEGAGELPARAAREGPPYERAGKRAGEREQCLR
jgi:hypothetical protein